MLIIKTYMFLEILEDTSSRLVFLFKPFVSFNHIINLLIFIDICLNRIFSRRFFR